jgi:hypothetical protein
MDETAGAAMWAIMQAFYALHIKLVDQGALDPGSVPDFLREMASADPSKFPVNHEAAVYFLNNMARALDAHGSGPSPHLNVIDGGKKD